MLKMAASLLLILGGAGIGYARSREITEREKNLEILLQILFFSERRDPMRQQFSSRRIPGDCSKNQWIFWDNPSGCRTGNGRHRRKNLEEIMEFCIQRNFYQEIPEGRRGKKKWRFFGLLGADLAILTEKCR